MKTGFLKFFLATAFLVILAVSFLLFASGEWTSTDTVTLGWIVISAGLIWLGNYLISRWLDQRFSWSDYGNWRFVSQLLLILIYSLAVVNLAYYLFKIFFTETPPFLEQFIVMNAYGTLIIVPISSIYFGVYFLRSWNKSKVETERAKKEAISAQLQTLRNHLDPHFLFNNLNILSALIETDTKSSAKFLERFAEVYRVILKTDKEELIPLADELEFIDSYLYLIKIRFEELIQITIDIPEEKMDRMLPPLTMQMLIENAFKHNQITEDEALLIKVYCEADMLVVENSLNRKEGTREVGGSGLKNIQLRYAYYTDQKIQVSETETIFKVEVPLIEITQHESINI